MSLARPHIGHAVAVLLLVLAAVRLGALCRDQVRRNSDSASALSTMPHRSSLRGIGSSGVAVGTSASARFVLMFPIRAANLADEVDYWNAVVNQLTPLMLAIDYWGVCDAGFRCDGATAKAKFALLGFLDPLQMHVMSEVKARGGALVYDSNGTFRGGVTREATPAATAATVRERVSR